MIVSLSGLNTNFTTCTHENINNNVISKKKKKICILTPLLLIKICICSLFRWTGRHRRNEIPALFGSVRFVRIQWFDGKRTETFFFFSDWTIDYYTRENRSDRNHASVYEQWRVDDCTVTWTRVFLCTTHTRNNNNNNYVSVRCWRQSRVKYLVPYRRAFNETRILASILLSLLSRRRFPLDELDWRMRATI